MPAPTYIENELEQALDESLKNFCRSEVEKQSHKKDPFLTPEAKKERLHAQIKSQVEVFKKRVSEGFLLCVEVLKARAAIDPSIDLNAVKENLSQAFEKLDSVEGIQGYAEEASGGKSWSVLLGLNAQTRELLYKSAEELFTSKRYSDAEAAFTFLITIDQTQYAFWIGLGHSSFHLGKHKEAAEAYSMASLCNPFSAWPHIYCANCFEAMSDFAQAVVCLHDAEHAYFQGNIRDNNFEELLRQRIANLKHRT